jgi:type IV pilus assembly protein PilN
MYNLDINFLRDRGIEKTADTSSLAQTKEPSLADKIPIAAGVIIALAAPAMAFGYLQTVNAKTATIETEIKQLESEIAELGNQNKKLDAVNQEIEAIEKETTAFIQVFENIKSWAAIMQEVSDRTPPGVIVDSIQQNASGAGAATATAKDADASTATSTPTGTSITIAGVARSYNDVNDFVLFLQRSPFFDGKQIKLNGASLADFPIEIENKDDLPDKASLEIPEGIKYTITAQLNNVPSSQLIKEINEKGSVGLVTRLKLLESKGAITK